MKKILLGVLFFSFLGINTAQSEVSVGWRCTIGARLSGFEGGIVYAAGYLNGEGDLLCTSAEGFLVEKRIEITIISGGLGLGYGSVSSVDIVGFDIGVQNVGDLFRQFSLSASVSGTLVNKGYGVMLSVKASNSGAGFELGFLTGEVKGLGAYLRASTMMIKEV